MQQDEHTIVQNRQEAYPPQRLGRRRRHFALRNG